MVLVQSVWSAPECDCCVQICLNESYQRGKRTRAGLKIITIIRKQINAFLKMNNFFKRTDSLIKPQQRICHWCIYWEILLDDFTTHYRPRKFFASYFSSCKNQNEKKEKEASIVFFVERDLRETWKAQNAAHGPLSAVCTSMNVWIVKV